MTDHPRRVTRALLPYLDGAHASETALESAPSRADAEDALRALLLLSFLDGAGDAAFDSLVAILELGPGLVHRRHHRVVECCSFSSDSRFALGR